MGETPRTREELLDKLERGAIDGRFVLRLIESLGLRIVPAELPHGYFDATKEAMARAHKEMGDIWANVYRAAIASSPFAPEKDNG